MPAAPASRLGRLEAERTAARRARAVALARRATAVLEAMGVATVRVVGSLAAGGFHPGSDIDLLVIDCPDGLKYRIEGPVEDTLEGFPFHILYLEEISPERQQRLLAAAIHARDLR